MLKGTPIEKRDIHWHKKHERKLARAKARRKARKGINRRVGWQGSRYTLEDAEELYKRARARESQHKAGLWLWFISLKPIVLIRKLIYLIKK